MRPRQHGLSEVEEGDVCDPPAAAARQSAPAAASGVHIGHAAAVQATAASAAQPQRSFNEHLSLFKMLREVFSGLSSFSGTPTSALTAQAWCTLVEDAACTMIPDTDAARILQEPATVAWLAQHKLADFAKRQWEMDRVTEGNMQPVTWGWFSDWLAHKFPGLHPITALQEIVRLQQRQKEPLPSYIHRAARLGLRVPDTLVTPMTKTWHFVSGLRDEEVFKAVLREYGSRPDCYSTATISQVGVTALEAAAVLEIRPNNSSSSGGAGRSGSGRYRGGRGGYRSSGSGGGGDSGGSSSEGLNHVGGGGSGSGANNSSSSSGVCWVCKQPGHRFFQVPSCQEKWEQMSREEKERHRNQQQGAGEERRPRRGR